MSPLFRVRTITAFIRLEPQDFESPHHNGLETKIQQSSVFLSSLQDKLVAAGYEVQTVRIATNPFGHFLLDDPTHRLDLLDSVLSKHHIQICALGPAQSLPEVDLCPQIVASSPKLSCSANIAENDVTMARAVADCIIQISKLDNGDDALRGGLGNFRFCGASCCATRGVPFFPASVAPPGEISEKAFALGLENGPLAYQLLSDCESLANIPTTFSEGMAAALTPVQNICEEEEEDSEWNFLGIDTSLNPSLDSERGSVAAALETLQEVSTFGGPGTVAGAAAVTKALQTLPGIKTTGYCGFMLPVCEDLRLATLSPSLRISNLLSVSAVCGVGVDTVPLAGNVSSSTLTSLLLDVANLAARWNKPLSCRVFPVPGASVGDTTQFDSPYLCNSKIFDIE